MGLNWRGWQIGAYAGEVLAAVGMVALLLQRRWHGAIILAIVLAGSLAFTYWQDRLPRLFALLVVVAALANGAGYIWNLWMRVAPYDELVHGFTIFALTLAFAFLVARALPAAVSGHAVLLGLLVACAGVTVGALWEVAEWILDMIPGLSIINPYQDTIVDLIMDSLGASLAAALGMWIVYERSQPAERAQPDTGNPADTEERGIA